VPYPSAPFAQTHPDRLATMATLYGLSPARVDRCRVLELGCGNGANLIPLAVELPDAVLLGIDRAGGAIEEGRATIRRLGLTNIELRALDVLDFPSDAGSFDYIVAHGLYSWVPPVVQDAILAVCAAHLAPDGVAFVSYNALPGGRVRQIVRDLLRFHAREADTPREQIDRARAAATDALAALPDDPSTELLRRELATINEKAPGVVFHDDLAPRNEFLQFEEFAARAARHGLQYLAEADIFEMQDTMLPPAAREQLRRVEAERGIIAREQALDFLRLRQFRQTLLCRADRPLERTLTPARLRDVRGLRVSSPVAPSPESRASESRAPVDLRGGAPIEFRGPRGAVLRTDDPLTIGALLALGTAWPAWLRLEELLTRAQRLAGLPSDRAHPLALAELVLEAFTAGLARLHVYAPPLVVEAGRRPVASPLARLQAEAGPTVTSLLHTNVEVESAPGSRLLGLLDGTRTRAALADDLTTWALTQPDVALPPPPALARAIDQSLARFGRLGLLLA